MQGSESEGRDRSTDGVLTRAIEALKDYPYFVFPLAIAVLAVTAGGFWGQFNLAIALLLFAVAVLVVVLFLWHRIPVRERELGRPPRSPSMAQGRFPSVLRPPAAPKLPSAPRSIARRLVLLSRGHSWSANCR